MMYPKPSRTARVTLLWTRVPSFSACVSARKSHRPMSASVMQAVLVVCATLSWVTVRVNPPSSVGVPQVGWYPVAERVSRAWMGSTMTRLRNELPFSGTRDVAALA
jgi:hypothetical protein